MGCKTIRTPALRERFLSQLSKTGNATAAAEACRVGRTPLYAWRNEDPGFADDWDKALELGTEGLEDIARKRAEESSDYLMALLLRGLKPERYQTRSSVNMTSTLTLDLRKLPSDELYRRIAELEATADRLRREDEAELVGSPDVAPPSRRLRGKVIDVPS